MVNTAKITTPKLFSQWDALDVKYTPGFEGEGVSEAIPGAVPDTVTPQKCPYGLYAEQLSGSSFTTPRVANRRSWQYRIYPSAKHEKAVPSPLRHSIVSDFGPGNKKAHGVPYQLRWNPLPLKSIRPGTDFVQGLVTYGGAGSPLMKEGLAIHIYACNTTMKDRAFFNSDGDMLIVPQEGPLLIRTEFGILEVANGEFCVIQRGIKFSVAVKGPSRGYVCEVYGKHFVLPDLGPIGANGLANARHFETPVASFEDRKVNFTVVQKFLGSLFEFKQDHSCFDVVGWTGNYVPYKYNLSKFVAVNSVTVDHMDPSIFTVMTSQTNEAGVAGCDFVVFPPRWSVHTKTFRPPYYHRNCMSEFMGNIRGTYEAKLGGFVPGGASLHNVMMAHGPDAQCFEGASNAELKPVPPIESALAFMFESYYVIRVTDYALNGGLVQEDYCEESWADLKKHFKTPPKPRL